MIEDSQYPYQNDTKADQQVAVVTADVAVNQFEGDYDDWPPRGSCPFCGSNAVYHNVLGMPTAETVEAAPPWVSFGCVPTVGNRRCESCGRVWTSGVEDGHWVHDLDELFAYFQVSSFEDLAEVMVDVAELDDEPRFDDGATEEEITPVLGVLGASRKFPMTIQQFIRALQEFEDETLEMWEAEHSNEGD